MKLPPLRDYGWTWASLLALLAITCGTSFLPLGRLNLGINLAVAVAKALLVVFVFMRIGKDGPMVKVVALMGLVMLGVLVGLSLTDFAVRGW